MVLLCRSALFMPGNRYRMIYKLNELNKLDLAVFDLEDAVPIEEKETGRIFVKRALSEQIAENTPKLVRVNGLATGLMDDDLDNVVREGLYGIVLPKCESGEQVTQLAEELTKLENERDIEEGSVKILPLLESAKGVTSALEIAEASDRNIGLSFGAGDYYRDFGRSYAEFTDEQDELLHARSEIVNAARSAGLTAIDTPFLGMLPDIEGLYRESRIALRLGYDGKYVTHPTHIDPVNETFTPSKEEVGYAEEVVEAYEKAKEQGRGATTLKGRMIDQATYAQAKEKLSTAGAIRAGKEG